MNVALYARVSSERQAERDLSIPAQLKALREYAQRQKWTVACEFVDEAESARTADRPAFAQMIADARLKPPAFQAILVWKLSRFARNREDSIVYKSLLKKRGLQVISINEPLEDSPAGRLLEGIIEVIDEFYSANLSQDVIRGMRENASRGFFNGSRPPFGYRTVRVRDGSADRRRLEREPAAAAVVCRIFKACVNGQGLKEIAKDLNRDAVPSPAGKKWGTTGVHKILKTEAYVGALIWGKRNSDDASQKGEPVRVEGAFEPIIDPAAFAKAAATLASRAPSAVKPRTVGSRFLLSGIFRCGVYGSMMIGHSAKGGKFDYYVCGTAYRKGNDTCQG